MALSYYLSNEGLSSLVLLLSQKFALQKSAELKGRPTTTTPPITDDSERIASTAFVQALMQSNLSTGTIDKAIADSEGNEITATYATKTEMNAKLNAADGVAYDASRLGGILANEYAQLNSPALTGVPTAPTATAGTDTTQVATTAFVKTAVDNALSNMLNSAPEALNTLSELAEALGNDPNFATTLSTTLGQKVDIDSPNYIKSVAISGQTITLTKGDDTTSTLTTQDTTYSVMTAEEATAGTEVEERLISPKVLHDKIDAMLPTNVSDLTNDSAFISSVAWDDVLNKPADFTPSAHNQASNTINVLTGYEKASSIAAISAEDSLNVALGKLEKALDDKQVAGQYLTPTSTLDASKLEGEIPSACYTNTEYAHPTTAGYKHIPAGGEAGQILRWSDDGEAVWGADNNSTYTVFGPSGANAADGLVPAPSETAGTTKFLREDGTWTVPANTTYTADNGIALSGTTFYNTGVRSLVAGQTNGTLTVNTNGTTVDVSIPGLGTGAFTDAYVHPTTSGSKHIPAGGSEGQILRWSADGVAAWDDDDKSTIQIMTVEEAVAGTSEEPRLITAKALNDIISNAMMPLTDSEIETIWNENV